MSYFATMLSAQAHTLRLPADVKEDVERFVLQHSKGGSKPERTPFRRQLDFWAFSIATALAKKKKPLGGPSSRWGRKFADTRAVQLPEDLCNLLAVLALAELGAEHEGIDDPAEIVELGNRFAGAGAPEVLRSLKSPDLRLTPLEKALDLADGMLRKSSGPAQTQ